MKKINFSWRWFEIGLVAVSLLVHLYIASRPANTLMNWYTSDDGFYYFKVAANVTSGLGATFDGISRTNGFHPLWMLVCIPVFALARFDLVLPLRLLVLVSALLNAGTGILIFRLLRRFISSWTAAAASVFWVFLPSIHDVVVQNGMESAISAFFLVLLVYLVAQQREERLSFWKLAPVGIVAGLAILARLDNIFVVMLIGAWFILELTGDYLRTIIVGDLALVFIVGLLGYYFRLPAGFLYIANSVSMPWHIALSFILIPLSLLLFGLYRSSAEKLSWKFLVRCFLAVALASGLTGVFLLVFQKVGLIASLPRSVILINLAGTLLCVVGLRLLAGTIFHGEAVSEKFPLLSRTFWKTILPGVFGYFIPLALLLGIYMTWSYLYVGTPMPISGQVKHWWGELPNTVYGSIHHTLPEVFGFAGRAAWDLAVSPLHFLENTAAAFLQPGAALTVGRILDSILILLVAAVLFLQRKWLVTAATKLGLFPFFLGLYAQLLYYTSTGYIHIRNWYWVGETLFTVICLGILLECAYLTFNRVKAKPSTWGAHDFFKSGAKGSFGGKEVTEFFRKLRRKPVQSVKSVSGNILLAPLRTFCWQAVMALLSLTVLAFFARMVIQRFPYSVLPENQDDYLTEIHALEAATEAGAIIGQTGGGTTGYFIEARVIVNLDGLINSPEYFHLLKAGQGAVYLDRIGLDYVFGNKLMLTASDPYSQLLEGHLEWLSQIGETTLYRYIPSPAEK